MYNYYIKTYFMRFIVKQIQWKCVNPNCFYCNCCRILLNSGPWMSPAFRCPENWVQLLVTLNIVEI